jgi:hypothetical protein
MTVRDETPDELWDAVALAHVRNVRAEDPDPVLGPELTDDERHGIIRLTTYNGSQIFVDFDHGRYYRAPKTTNYFCFDWQWTRSEAIGPVRVGAVVRFDSLTNWYQTSLVRYIDRLLDGVEAETTETKVLA